MIDFPPQVKLDVYQRSGRFVWLTGRYKIEFRLAAVHEKAVRQRRAHRGPRMLAQ